MIVQQDQLAASPPQGGDRDDWLDDSEEQMQVENAMWEATHARHKDKFLTLREAARAEIKAFATSAEDQTLV